MGTNYWNTAKGQQGLKRMIISVIYTFGIKGGAGAGRIAEHFSHLNFGLSGVEQWLPFFEETSEKRDSESRWSLIQSKVLDLGISVKGIVSDRAKALVSLGNTEHLNVVSMPDLFHFV